MSKGREAEKIYAQRAFAEQARTLGFTWREIAKACGKSSHATIIKMCQHEGWREKNIEESKRRTHDNNKRRI